MRLFLKIKLAGLAAIVASGCATTSDSVLLGASTGAGVGAATGALTTRNSKGESAWKGALIGGAVGALSSYIIHGKVKKRDDKVRRETLFNLEKFGVSGVPSSSGAPGITFPVVEENYIEPHVKGRTYHEGHKVWVIQEDAQWILDGDKRKRISKKKKDSKRGK